MSEENRCPVCAAALPTGETAGLCPKCLLQAGLAESDEPQVAGPYSPTTPQPGGFCPPQPEELAPHFPHLEILELLGHGGMGAVYKARQSKLGRFVALKVIRPESSDDPAFAERFMREARTMARLNHPGIVAIYDFGDVPISAAEAAAVGPFSRTLFYFVMEFVDGPNLRKLIQTETVQPHEALSVVAQVCDALQFAHEEGVVHRDIKPENVLLDHKGRVKIADFGLAKLAARSDEEYTLTATHQVMGTPRYMAPEQMAGSHSVDHRADLYSLGVVLYEMLTGEVPAGHFELPSQKAGTDSRLDDVILRAMASDPGRRFQSASEMKSCVAAIGSSESGGAPAVAGHRQPSYPTGVSTIFQREFAAAWNWVVPEPPGESTRRPKLPAMFMLLLCLAGAAMLVVPWMDVKISAEEVKRVGGDAVVTAEHPDGKPIQKTYIGSDRLPGTIATAAFALFALLVISTPTTRPISLKRSLSLTVVAAVALLNTIMFKTAIEEGNAPEPLQTLLTSVQHDAAFHAGFYTSLVCSAVLLLLSGVGIREALSHRPQELPGADTHSGSPRFSRKAIVGACLAPLGLGAIPFLAYLMRGGAPGFNQAGLFLVTAMSPFCILGPIATTVLGLIAVHDIRKSSGKLRGLWLAFIDAMFFPFLISDAALVLFFENTRPPRSDLAETVIVLAAGFWFLGQPLILWLLWRAACRPIRPGEDEAAGRSSKGSVAGTPVARLRFTASRLDRLDPVLMFHFGGLGYELVDSQPHRWVFRRGSKWAWVLLETDIKKFPTTLTVHAVTGLNVDVLIDCVWFVQSGGAWITNRDVRKLEAEGRDLESLLATPSSSSNSRAGRDSQNLNA